jgi:recombination protein RecT
MQGKELQTTNKNDIAALLNDPRVKVQVQRAIPRHMDPDKLLRVALTAIRQNPNLMRCNTQSLLACVMGAAQLGLEPEPALGQVYLVPYFNKKKNQHEATLIPGYRGYIALARRSGEVQSVSAQVVYENDEFQLEYGLNETLRHVPADGDRGGIKGAYVVFKYKDGGHSYDYMSKADIDKIRARSKSSDSGPWVTDYPEMAKKTVIRRHIKLVPLSVELTKAAFAENLALAGESQTSMFMPEIEERPAAPAIEDLGPEQDRGLDMYDNAPPGVPEPPQEGKQEKAPEKAPERPANWWDNHSNWINRRGPFFCYLVRVGMGLQYSPTRVMRGDALVVLDDPKAHENEAAKAPDAVGTLLRANMITIDKVTGKLESLGFKADVWNAWAAEAEKRQDFDTAPETNPFDADEVPESNQGDDSDLDFSSPNSSNEVPGEQKPEAPRGGKIEINLPPNHNLTSEIAQAWEKYAAKVPEVVAEVVAEMGLPATNGSALTALDMIRTYEQE